MENKKVKPSLPLLEEKNEDEESGRNINNNLENDNNEWNFGNQ